MEEILNRIYYNVRDPSGFSSVKTLYDKAKKEIPSLTLKNVTEWLSRQKSYSLLKPARNKFKRNRVLVSGLNEEFQADLLDVTNLSSSNKGFKFLLTVIDVLSKYAYAIPLKRKTATEVRDGFQKIFAERVPAVVQTDDGNEFKGAVKTLFSEYGVHHIIANDARIKCSIAERFNKTLRLKIARYLRFTNKNVYIDVLPDILHAYNNTVHTSIRMRPIDVTIDTQQQAFDNLYGNRTYREMLLEAYRKRTNLKLGDFVRVKLFKKTFTRGYQDSWSQQLYRVSEVLQTNRKPMFRVTDSVGVLLPKKFYKDDLQKIVPTQHQVSLTNRKRTRGGQTEVEVVYDGFDKACWIPETSLFNE